MVIQLIFLFLTAGYAIKMAETTNWKLRNFGTVVCFMVAGFCLTFIAGYLVGRPVDTADGLTFSTIAGYVGSFGAIAGNKWREGGIGKGHKTGRTANDKTLI
jgi:hypothetical protein